MTAKPTDLYSPVSAASSAHAKKGAGLFEVSVLDDVAYATDNGMSGAVSSHGIVSPPDSSRQQKLLPAAAATDLSKQRYPKAPHAERQQPQSTRRLRETGGPQTHVSAHTDKQEPLDVFLLDPTKTRSPSSQQNGRQDRLPPLFQKTTSPSPPKALPLPQRVPLEGAGRTATAGAQDVAGAATAVDPASVNAKGRVAYLVERFQTGGRGELTPARERRVVPEFPNRIPSTSHRVIGTPRRMRASAEVTAAGALRRYRQPSVGTLTTPPQDTTTAWQKFTVATKDPQHPSQRRRVVYSDVAPLQRKDLQQVSESASAPPSPTDHHLPPPSTDAGSVEALLKLDSDLSDDGYNAIAPIHHVHSRRSEPALVRSKRISIYQWATGEVGGGEGTLSSNQSSLSSPASQVVRRPPQNEVNRDASSRPVNVFVGTWNTEYCEFPLGAMLSKYPPELPVPLIPAVAADVVSTSTVVGSYTSDAMKIRAAIRLDSSHVRRTHSDRDFNTVHDSPLKAQTAPACSGPLLSSRSSNNKQRGVDDKVGSGSVSDEAERDSSESDVEGDTLEADTEAMQRFRASNPPPSRRRVLAEKTFSPLPNSREPFADWIPLQEVVSDRMFDAILLYLNRANKKRFVKIHFSEDKISGLGKLVRMEQEDHSVSGDGAYLSMKSTSIACFVAEDVLGDTAPVNAGSSKAMSLNSLNGSKGAVAIILTIHGQVVCFVSCHLPAGKPPARLKARETIRRRLAEEYCGFAGVDPTDVFHHIVWAGDFNLRIQEMGAESVLSYLYQGDLKTVLAFDEFHYDEFNTDFREYEFEEAAITFLPTYKKLVGRGPLNRQDPYSLHRTYNINYKVQWYKGGKVKERTPSWTDRIFKWSHPELKSCLVFLPETYKSAMPQYDTFLLSSDHDPVGCGLSLFALTSQYKLPAVLFYDKKKHSRKSRQSGYESPNATG